MTLETFFEKFDQFADAPDAVAKMRELIMWSAFSGAFSAEERNQPVPVEWALEGGPTLPAIPSSWKWQRGSEVFDVIRGVSYKKNEASDSPVEGSFPVLRANNIGNLINFDGLVYVPRDNIRDEQFVRRGDILIAMSSGSKKLVGKASPIVVDFIGAFGAFCGVIRNKSGITDAVLSRYFQSPQYTSWVTAAGRGIGINNLSKGDLDSLPIPTPPLAEQKWIVAKLDELMALCGRLETQQQERKTRQAALTRASLARFAAAPSPANLNFIFHPSYAIPPADLRKSILTLAVQGKLVPQDPTDEPADLFLGQIAERLGKSKGKRSTNNVAATADEAKPFDLPSGWAWSRFPDLGEFGRGKSKHRPRNDPSLFAGGTHRLVQTGDVARANGTIQTHTGLYNDVGLAQSKKWPAGTLCITIAANIADSGILGFDACFPDSVVGFIPAAPIPSVQYFEFFMRTAKEHLEQFAPSTAQKNINLGILEQVWIPIPPLAEQRRIVAKVEQLMALVDALETQLAASRVSAANLLSAVVAELTRSTQPKEPQHQKAA